MRGERPAQVGCVAPAMDGAVEKIRDHADVVLDAKLPVRVGLEAFGDSRDAVRLLDAEGHGFRIRAVAAEQRDVGAVQRRDDLGHTGATSGRQDLARQIPRGRVRDRVVRVDDLELLVARDLDDLVGERQEVLRFAEQRIGRRFDPVEEQARLVLAEPGRHVAAQDVDAMAARRERLAELGRDDAAAADRRVADDPDVHVSRRGHPSRRPPRRRPLRKIGSRTTKPSAQRTPARAPNCASRLSTS